VSDVRTVSASFRLISFSSANALSSWLRFT
jgi:hypothetical protein